MSTEPGYPLLLIDPKGWLGWETGKRKSRFSLYGALNTRRWVGFDACGLTGLCNSRIIVAGEVRSPPARPRMTERQVLAVAEAGMTSRFPGEVEAHRPNHAGLNPEELGF